MKVDVINQKLKNLYFKSWSVSQISSIPHPSKTLKDFKQYMNPRFSFSSLFCVKGQKQNHFGFSLEIIYFHYSCEMFNKNLAFSKKENVLSVYAVLFFLFSLYFFPPEIKSLQMIMSSVNLINTIYN